MRGYLAGVLIASVLIMMPCAFGEDTYQLQVDDKTFPITYEFDGSLISMDVDKQSTSLLVGIKDTKDSEFMISFPSEVLDAQNGDFIVLVDGLETDYSLLYKGDNPTISFPMPQYSEEVEIIGTSVIPEFPFGALAVMIVVTTTIVLLSKQSRIFK